NGQPRRTLPGPPPDWSVTAAGALEANQERQAALGICWGRIRRARHRTRDLPCPALARRGRRRADVDSLESDLHRWPMIKPSMGAGEREPVTAADRSLAWRLFLLSFAALFLE